MTNRAEKVYSLDGDRILLYDSEQKVFCEEPFTPMLLPEGVEGMEESDDDLHVERCEEGKLAVAYTQREGVPCGEWRSYHPNGNVRAIQHYQHDKASKKSVLHGPSEVFSNKGQLLSVCCFIDGEREGKCLQYDDQGNLIASLTYCRDKLEGDQKYFYSTGTPKAHLQYSAGVLHGKAQLFYDVGSPRREIDYKDGIATGVQTQFFRNGNKESERLMEGGVLVQETFWNALGTLVEKHHYHPSKHQDVTKWDENGQKRVEEIFQGDSFEHREWNEDGVLAKEYIGDVLGGVRKILAFKVGSPTEAESKQCNS